MEKDSGLEIELNAIDETGNLTPVQPSKTIATTSTLPSISRKIEPVIDNQELIEKLEK